MAMGLRRPEAVISGPHPSYTEALLSAVPKLDRTESSRIRLDGEIPSAPNPPTGCVFHTRCPRKIGAICETQEPRLTEGQPGHTIRCHIFSNHQNASKTFAFGNSDRYPLSRLGPPINDLQPR